MALTDLSPQRSQTVGLGVIASAFAPHAHNGRNWGRRSVERSPSLPARRPSPDGHALAYSSFGIGSVRVGGRGARLAGKRLWEQTERRLSREAKVRQARDAKTTPSGYLRWGREFLPAAAP